MEINYINHFFGPFDVVVRLCGVVDPVLEFLAIGEIVVNGLAGQAVGPSADRTTEDVDVVLDDGPSGAVGRLAVESVGHRLLR